MHSKVRARWIEMWIGQRFPPGIAEIELKGLQMKCKTSWLEDKESESNLIAQYELNQIALEIEHLKKRWSNDSSALRHKGHKEFPTASF